MHSALRWLLFLLVAVALLGWWLIRPAHYSAGQQRPPSGLPVSVAPVAVVSPEAVRLTPSATPEPRVSHPPGKNGADFYKNAMVLYAALTPAEKALLRQPWSKADPTAAAALFEKLQPIMEILRKARDEAEYVDWALGEPRLAMPIPHMTAVMDLGRLTAWEAGYRLADEPRLAVADLAAGVRLAQSVGDNMMIGFLVGSAVEEMQFNVLRDGARQLTPEAFEAARQMMASLDLAGHLTKAVEWEATALRNEAKAMADPSERANILSLLESSRDQEGAPLKVALASKNVVEQFAWLAQTESALAQKFRASDAEYQAWQAALRQEGSGYEMAQQSLGTLDSVRARFRYATVKDALLLAGLSVLEGGPKQLAQVKDPLTGQPFAYRVTDSGFELSSTHIYKGKPVTTAFVTSP